MVDMPDAVSMPGIARKLSLRYRSYDNMVHSRDALEAAINDNEDAATVLTTLGEQHGVATAAASGQGTSHSAGEPLGPGDTAVLGELPTDHRSEGSDEADHLMKHWFGRGGTDWWPDTDNVAEVLLHGLKNALDVAIDKNLPIEILWVCESHDKTFHVFTFHSKAQVTMIIVTPEIGEGFETPDSETELKDADQEKAKSSGLVHVTSEDGKIRVTGPRIGVDKGNTAIDELLETVGSSGKS